MWTNQPSALLAQTQFVRFWLARLAGTIAIQMLMVAVAWQMYDITSSAWDLGLVGLFQFVPALLMTLPAGHVVDRLHRGRIFAACMLTQTAVALLLVAAIQGGFATRELILVVSVALGVARAFQMPAQQALTPQLVPKELLQRAIAMSTSGIQVAVISGPALGGVLYVAGATTVYACCTFLSLLSCALTLALRYPHRQSTTAATWRSVFAGVSFVWQRKVLL
ncbi:MFS transporter, partial [bacterium]|nr:MFS transporter [bacterium]